MLCGKQGIGRRGGMGVSGANSMLLLDVTASWEPCGGRWSRSAAEVVLFIIFHVPECTVLFVCLDIN